MRHSRAFRLSACHSAACSLSPSATVFSVSPNGLFRPAIEPLSCRGRAFAACRKSPSGMPEEQSVRCVASFSSCRLDENGAAAPSPPCRDTVSVPSPSLFQICIVKNFYLAYSLSFISVVPLPLRSCAITPSPSLFHGFSAAGPLSRAYSASNFLQRLCFHNTLVFKRIVAVLPRPQSTFCFCALFYDSFNR